MKLRFHVSNDRKKKKNTFVQIKGLRGLRVKSYTRDFSPIICNASGKWVLNQAKIVSALQRRSRSVFGANKVQVKDLSYIHQYHE